MTPYRVATIVGCRILALYLFASYIGIVIEPLGTMIAGPFPLGLKELGIFSLLLIPSILLWILAPWISKQIVRYADADTGEEPKVTLEAIQVTAFALLGIYFVFQSLPRVVVPILTYYSMQQVELPPHYTLYRMVTIPLIAALVKLGLGMWLFVGSRGFVKIFKKLQNAGLPGNT